MTLTPVQEVAKETVPDATELLIKEARRESRRRRLRVGVTVLIVVAATIVIWQVSGGSPHSTPPMHVRTSNPTRGAPTGSTNNSATAVIEGQSVMSFVPIGSSALWVFTQNEVALTGGDQGIELTTNDGKSWTNATPPGLGTDGSGRRFMGGLFALSTTRAWIAFGDASNGLQTLETTGNAGRTWSKVGVLPPSGCQYQFVTVEDGTCTTLQGAMGSMSVIIYRTVTGGVTWQRVFDNTSLATSSTGTEKGSIPFGCDKSVNFTSATKGFALFFCNGGSGAIIYESLNGGTTWTSRIVTQPSSVPEGGGGFWGPPVMVGLNAAVSYSVGPDSLVYVTHNGGHSFLPVYPPGKPRRWAVDIVSPSIWRLTRGKDILATNNAGRSWFTVKSDLVLESDNPMPGEPPGGTLVMATNTDGWFFEDPFGTHPLLLRTTDGGRQWEKFAVPGTGKLRHND